MIRILLFLVLLTLWSCSNSSQETPAPPPQPPAAPAAADATPGFKPTEPPQPAPAPAESHVDQRAADLATTTSDLQLVTKNGFRTNEGIVIKGRVKNTTDKDYHFVEISFNVYDKENKKIAVVRSTTDSLDGGRTWNFEIKAPYLNAVTSTLDRLGGF